jgi:hypothetical protein
MSSTQSSSLTERDMERARKLIARHTWTFARSMPWIPHEYVVREGAASDAQHRRGSAVEDRPFEWFVTLIRKHGRPRTFGKKKPRTFTYLTVDGKRYWTMGNPMSDTTIINRAVEDDSLGEPTQSLSV